MPMYIKFAVYYDKFGGYKSKEEKLIFHGSYPLVKPFQRLNNIDEVLTIFVKATLI